MLGATRFKQVKEGIQSSLLRHPPKKRDASAYAEENKIRLAGNVIRLRERQSLDQSSKRLDTMRHQTHCSKTIYLFTKSFKEKYDALRVPREKRYYCTCMRS
ncbi:hypothetical protein RB195_024910 [Necator americanus]|uniref:Uncharacterized protein n=1 Tax=Necator americanus TaxID=51031 RepID=A0ABR1EQ23_NECAM